MIKKSISLTAEGKKELEKELDELIKNRPAIAERIATARAFGDLSENEEYNIQSVSILMRDATILEKAESKKCKFYCHIRNNSVHRVIENKVSRSGIEIKAVDSSRLSIDLLKYKKEYHKNHSFPKLLIYQTFPLDINHHTLNQYFYFS